MLSTTLHSDHDTCPKEGMNASVKARVLHDACVKLGGEAHLAEYLQAPVSLVHAWLQGHGMPPDDIFLKCLDLIDGRDS